MIEKAWDSKMHLARPEFIITQLEQSNIAQLEASGYFGSKELVVLTRNRGGLQCQNATNLDSDQFSCEPMVPHRALQVWKAMQPYCTDITEFNSTKYLEVTALSKNISVLQIGWVKKNPLVKHRQTRDQDTCSFASPNAVNAERSNKDRVVTMQSLKDRSGFAQGRAQLVREVGAGMIDIIKR